MLTDRDWAAKMRKQMFLKDMPTGTLACLLDRSITWTSRVLNARRSIEDSIKEEIENQITQYNPRHGVANRLTADYEWAAEMRKRMFLKELSITTLAWILGYSTTWLSLILNGQRHIEYAIKRQIEAQIERYDPEYERLMRED